VARRYQRLSCTGGRQTRDKVLSLSRRRQAVAPVALPATAPRDGTRIATFRHGGAHMRELEASLQEYAEFLVKARLVKEKAAPYV